MRYRRSLLALASSLAIGAFLLHCVGDAPVVQQGADSGVDGNVNPDGNVTPDGAPVEAGPPAPDGSLAWVQHFNSNVEFEQVAIRESPTLSFVVAGGYRNSASGNDAVTNVGSYVLPKGGNTVSPVIAALDPLGNPIWVNVPATTSSGVGNGGDVNLSSIATDAAGDIYIAGSTSRGSITLNQVRNGSLAFVTKLKSDGKTFLWDHVFTGTGSMGAPKLSVVGTQIAVAAAFSQNITYDPAKIMTSVGSNDIAVLSLNAGDGTTRWATSFGGTGFDGPNDVAIDAAGDAFVVGSGIGSISGTGAGFPLACKGTDYNGIFAKFAFADGKGLYTMAWGDPASSGQTNALGIDVRAGKVVVSGQFGGGVDFGKGVLGATGQVDGFVVEFDDATKATAFAATMGGSQYEGLQSVAFDAWGQVLAAGQYGSPDAKIGSTALKPTSFRTSGFVVAKWDVNGGLVWAKSVVPTTANGGIPYPVQDAGAAYLSIWATYARVTKGGVVVTSGGMSGGSNFGDGIYRPRLSGMGAEYFQICNPTCPTVFSPDSLVGAWNP